MNRRVELLIPIVVMLVAVAAYAGMSRSAPRKARVQMESHPLVEATLADIKSSRDPERPLILLVGSSTLNMAMHNVEDYVDHRCEQRKIEQCPEFARLMLSGARLSDFAAYIPDMMALDPSAVVVEASVLITRPRDTDLPHRNPEAMRDGPRPGPETTEDDRFRVRRQWESVYFEPDLRDMGTLKRLYTELGESRLGLLVLPTGPTLIRAMPKGYRASFLRAVDELATPRNIPVFRVADDADWSDSYTYDFAHMNRDGTAKVRASGVVAEIMRFGMP